MFNTWYFYCILPFFIRYFNSWDCNRYEKNSLIYKLNGALYIATAKQLISDKSFYSNPTRGAFMDSPIESIYIDTPIDWALTEKLMELNQEALV